MCVCHMDKIALFLSYVCLYLSHSQTGALITYVLDQQLVRKKISMAVSFRLGLFSKVFASLIHGLFLTYQKTFRMELISFNIPIKKLSA